MSECNTECESKKLEFTYELSEKLDFKYTTPVEGRVFYPYFEAGKELYILTCYGDYYGTRKIHVELLSGQGPTLAIAHKNLERKYKSYIDRVINDE